MSEKVSGSISIIDGTGEIFAIELDASGSDAIGQFGNVGIAGVLSLVDAKGGENVYASGAGGFIRVGGEGADGDLWLMPRNIVYPPTDLSKATIHLGGESAVAELGGGGQAGRCIARDEFSNNRATLHGASGSLTLATVDGHTTVQLQSQSGDAIGRNGAISLIDSDGNKTFHAEGGTGLLRVGGPGVSGQIHVLDDNGARAVTISGDDGGKITFGNADCAEEFDADLDCDPGSVVVIGDDEKLRVSSTPYDRRVAGVLAGAGSYQPALVLDRRADRDGRKPVALVGKVFCKVDATQQPIEAGDLLTTSATPGHAMKAEDPMRAFGAVLGKALRPCAGGLGLIPVLVALQ